MVTVLFRQNGDELVTIYPGHERSVSRLCHYAAAGHRDQGVAVGMAKSIIHQIKVVQINKHDCPGRLALARLFQLRLKMFV